MNDLRSIPFEENGRTSFVVFCLDQQQYALPLSAVERIIHAVEVTALPSAPSAILGVINAEGRVLPVFNLRRRFGLREREISPADQFLIARTQRRTVALVVDEARNVIQRSATDILAMPEIVPGLNHIQGVVKLEDGLVLIHSLEKFLSLDEANALDEAMRPEVAGGN